jgi:hypothetical protein
MLSRIQTFCCPNCGNRIGEAQPVDILASGDLKPQQRVIIRAMQASIGAWVDAADLAAALWGSAQKLHSTPARRRLSVLIADMQADLVRYGWTIAGDRRGHYKLIPMERGA